MKAGAVDTDHIIQGKDNGYPSCRVSGTVTLLLVAAYFYFGCKHVKPVYYFGTPSMISLAVARAFDLTSFKGQHYKISRVVRIYIMERLMKYRKYIRQTFEYIHIRSSLF